MLASKRTATLASKPSNIITHPAALVDINDTTAGPVDLIHELIHNRDCYRPDPIDSSIIVIYGFPKFLRIALSVICSRVDTKMGGDPGLNLAAVVALEDGFSLIMEEPPIKNLLKLRTKFYAMDRKPVDKTLMDELSSVLDKWGMFAQNDSGGSRRLQVNRVANDLNGRITAAHHSLGISKGQLGSLCIARCLGEQASISRERRRYIDSVMDTFWERVRVRIVLLDALIDTLASSSKFALARKKRKSRVNRTK